MRIETDVDPDTDEEEIVHIPEAKDLKLMSGFNHAWAELTIKQRWKWYSRNVSGRVEKDIALMVKGKNPSAKVKHKRAKPMSNKA